MWWFIGVIPLAYFARSRAILTIAILVALGLLGYVASGWLDYGDAFYAFFPFYLTLGLVLYGIGAVHSRFERLRYYTSRYQTFGLILVFGVLYVLSFKVFFEGLALAKWNAMELPVAFLRTFHTAAALTIMCAAASLTTDIARKRLPYISASELGALAIFVAIGYIVLFLPFNSPVSSAVTFNLILFAGIIGLIFLGYLKGVSSFVNVALLFFGLAVLSRYFDLTWKFMPRSVFFILDGLLLLGGGVLLERMRRTTLGKMRAIEVGDEEET